MTPFIKMDVGRYELNRFWINVTQSYQPQKQFDFRTCFFR